MGRRAKPKEGKAKAKRPLARTSPKNDASRVRDLEKRLGEALEREKAKDRALAGALAQQTATSEILRVISQSQTDVQPVFNTIVQSGLRLLGGFSATMMLLRDNDCLELVAYTSTDDEADASLVLAFPLPLPRAAPAARRAIHERRAHVVEDIERIPDVTDVTRELGRARGWRSNLFVPMIRDGVVLGLISITRRDPGPVATGDIALLETFADQAVIAIENVRLFNETKEALEQQTATSEILRGIASSPTDVQPVFDAIARHTVALCEGVGSVVVRYDGAVMRLAAFHNVAPESREIHETEYPRAPDRTVPLGVAILDGTIVHVPNLQASSRFAGSPVQRSGRASMIAVPLLRNGRAIGAIGTTRDQPEGFSDRNIALLQTFADQAVIAIENVRLFTELQSRNAEVTEALERQVATGAILRAISQSPTDSQPVFETIMRNGVRVCEASSCLVFVVVDDQLHLVATDVDQPHLAQLRSLYPAKIDAELPTAQAIRERRVVHVPDVEHNPEASPAMRRICHAGGYRTVLFVPMLREDLAVGAVSVGRTDATPFSDRQIELLQTFADQAVIAIENVRLFKELQEKNKALTEAHAQVTEALEQQTATSEVLKVISRSTIELQPVLETLIENATRLCGADRGQVYKAEGEALRSATVYGLAPEVVDYLQQRPLPIDRHSMAGRAALERRTIHVSDVLAETWFQPPDDRHHILDLRTVLAVPMLREETVVGVFTIWKTTVDPFTDRQVELVTTFADQAVIAIENVRLFKELDARTRELTHSVEELQALGEVSQAVGSTLELEIVLATIVSRAVQMSESYGGIVYEFDEATQAFHARATYQVTPEHLDALRRTPVRLGEGAVGRAGVIREPLEVADIEAAWQLVAPQVRMFHEREGIRSLLAIPLVREDRLFGGLVILRREKGVFPPEVVATLRTLAAQSVLAIQNARLFLEIGEKSRQLESASRHKSEFLANMSHELRTPLNAIIGYSELLEEEAGDLDGGRLVPDLQKIAAAAQHQLSLINDILDLSKIEAGRMELEVTDFDLPSIIDNALTLVRERATRRGIKLQATMDPRLGAVQGDERKIKQVLLNLLSNAVKFTPERGRIEVRTTLGDGTVEISVTDTGSGIAPEDQAAVFEEFRQVGTADKKAEGTGLGLALSKRFIELHGGRIWVQSQIGHGSTFTFTLPVRREE